jgi:phosphoglycerate dehydrogenase-like enzyme
VISRKWKTKDPYRFMATDVWGKTMGIIGLGRIGAKIAQRARGFAMRVLYFDVVRKTDLETHLGAEYRSLKELLNQSDIVMIACPLTDDTRHMISETEFGSMKNTALLVNVARGEIMDHEALVQAVRHGHIGGVGLDVFDKEPIPVDDPLLSLNKVVLTPHLSANTIECRRRMALTVAEDVLRVLHGQDPRFAVNRQMRTATS